MAFSCGHRGSAGGATELVPVCFSALFGHLLRSRVLTELGTTAPVLRSLLLVRDGEHADVRGHELEDDLEREAVRDSATGFGSRDLLKVLGAVRDSADEISHFEDELATESWPFVLVVLAGGADLRLRLV